MLGSLPKRNDGEELVSFEYMTIWLVPLSHGAYQSARCFSVHMDIKKDEQKYILPVRDFDRDENDENEVHCVRIQTYVQWSSCECSLWASRNMEYKHRDANATYM